MWMFKCCIKSRYVGPAYTVSQNDNFSRLSNERVPVRRADLRKENILSLILLYQKIFSDW